jgi:two-component system, LytTR family, sensor histidine kinase AlgZ
MSDAATGTRGLLIPDLCSARAVLFLLLIGVLLALTLELFASGLEIFDWIGLGRASVFILWNVLASAACLCVLRARIASWPLAAGATLACTLVLAVCLASNLACQLLLGAVWSGTASGVDPWWLARDALICALLGGAALRYFHLQGELLRQQRAELAARVASLQARIRPHFLFNSMNIIASLIPLDPDGAERAVEDLSELFRASLREGATTVPLADELELCERYLRLEQLRLGERLVIERALAPVPAGVRIPPLSVQPLLENAIYHGVQTRPEGGTVRLELRADGRTLRVEVSNPLPAEPRRAGQGAGIALANIRDRLAAIYGERAGLGTASVEGRFVARLALPLTPPT